MSAAVARSSARSVRLRARLPRIAVSVVLAVLCLAGVRAIVAGPPEPAPPPRAPDAGDLGAEGFAEGFARAYLSWDADNPERREHELARYAASELEPGAGLEPGGSDQAVEWARAVADERSGPRRRLVTVAARTNRGLTYLAVPVARDGRGFLHLAGYPAIVGPPAVELDPSLPSEDELEDDRLRAVLRRVVTNYLAGEHADLQADLSPRAVVSLPGERLRVTAAEEMTWVAPGRRAAVLVEAQRPDETSLTLRYELGVERAGRRWLVRSVATNPTHKEVSK